MRPRSPWLSQTSPSGWGSTSTPCVATSSCWSTWASSRARPSVAEGADAPASSTSSRPTNRVSKTPTRPWPPPWPTRSRSSAGPTRSTADEAGLLWAQALVEQGRLRPTASVDEAVEQVTVLFSELGFDATSEPLSDRIYLRACPYAAIREAFPGVCEIHLGLLRGSLAVTESGLSIDGFDVEARPGLCVAHLGSSTTPSASEETKESS